MQTILDIDRDTEARKHLWLGLKRMRPAQRTTFLRWACRQVNGPNGVAEVKVTESAGHHGEVYWDLMNLAAAFGLDLGKTCEQMERVLRRL